MKWITKSLLKKKVRNKEFRFHRLSSCLQVNSFHINLFEIFLDRGNMTVSGPRKLENNLVLNTIAVLNIASFNNHQIHSKILITLFIDSYCWFLLYFYEFQLWISWLWTFHSTFVLLRLTLLLRDCFYCWHFFWNSSYSSNVIIY